MGSARGYPEIDLLKAVSIVCVVMIHAGRSFLNPHLSAGERALAVTTQFAVPCFLLCSGFLYAGTPTSRTWVTTRARLVRLLSPYLLAGVVAGLYRQRLLGEPVQWLRDMLLGHTFGAYYYVFVIFTLIVVTPVVARLPRWLRIPLGLFLVATGSLRSLAPLLHLTPETGARLNLGLDPAFPWHLRHPLLVWGYFFAGWELRGVYPWLARGDARPWLRHALLACWLGLTGMIGWWVSQGRGVPLAVAGWPHIWLSLALLVAWTFGRTVPRAGIQWLSRHTYFIYLYHLFFVLGAQHLWPQPHEVSWPLWFVYVWLGLAGPISLAVILERFLSPAALATVGLGRAGNLSYAGSLEGTDVR